MSGLWTINSGQVALNNGQWTVDSGQWTGASGQWTVDSGQWAVGSWEEAVDMGQWAIRVGSGQWTVKFGLAIFSYFTNIHYIQFQNDRLKQKFASGQNLFACKIY
jgi:hypothetical protein